MKSDKKNEDREPRFGIASCPAAQPAAQLDETLRLVAAARCARVEAESANLADQKLTTQLAYIGRKKRACELVIFLIFISNISAGLEEGYLPLCRLSCGSAATSISVSGTETRVSQHEASVPRPAMASLFVFFRKTKKSNKTFDLRRNEEVAMRHFILPPGEA